MTRKTRTQADIRPTAIAADPEQWSEKSKQSLPYLFGWRKEYADKPYTCWTCRTKCLFTAQDQKYSYEVKKAYIDQQRTLCGACWTLSNQIASQILACETRWAEEKAVLMGDVDFLAAWLDLLQRRERYIPYRPNAAHVNMLKKLLSNAGCP